MCKHPHSVSILYFSFYSKSELFLHSPMQRDGTFASSFQSFLLHVIAHCFFLMGKDYFQFKQFGVSQSRCAMKVSTDSVLLGAYAPSEGIGSILDIGCGTGLLSLMMAQRTEHYCKICAIEIDPETAVQAQENISASPWSSRITVIQKDFNHYSAKEPFDLIISNPPYFSSSLLPPNSQRALARHDGQLSLTQLFTGISKMLTTRGQAAIILPFASLQTAIDIALSAGLYATKALFVHPKTGSNPKRVILTFCRHNKGFEEEDFFIYDSSGKYTPSFLHLTKDFYL